MSTVSPPTNNLVTPLLTDLYQITMAYGYYKSKKQDQNAVFDLFFRKNPFGGEYVVFGGLDECVGFFKYVIYLLIYLLTFLLK